MSFPVQTSGACGERLCCNLTNTPIQIILSIYSCPSLSSHTALREAVVVPTINHFTMNCERYMRLIVGARQYEHSNYAFLSTSISNLAEIMHSPLPLSSVFRHLWDSRWCSLILRHTGYHTKLLPAVEDCPMISDY